MKAVVRTKYGPPDILRLQEVPKPSPQADQVLIQVASVSLNASDYEILTGKPAYVRSMGLITPKFQILGSDVAGRVEAVGEAVTKFQPGDEVFGDIFEIMGGFSEYVCAKENLLTQKPAGLSFEQAAAIPQSACLALQGIRDKGRVQSGKKILINGAGGGSGTFAIQIAKSLGADVTAVDNTEKLDVMRSLGADHVIDYTKENFTKNGQRYDLILDLAAHHSFFNYQGALSHNGIYLMVGGAVAMLFKLLFLGTLVSLFGKKKMGILALKANKDLNDIVGLINSGQVNPLIGKRYSLQEVPEALRYLGGGHAKGKVVINL